MIIYFVRHGSTEGNAANQFQLPTIELSEKGKQEAEFMAKRFEKIPVDILFASPMKRALQTAQAIGRRTGHPVIENALFEEIKRPSDVRGKSKEDPDVKKIMQDVKKHFTDPNWHHSDEENYFEVKERATKVLEFLSSRTEEKILVVTHGEILRMILGLVVFGETLTPEMFDHVKRAFIPFNTGITKIQYDPTIGYSESGWYVQAWNDHAHLEKDY